MTPKRWQVNFNTFYCRFDTNEFIDAIEAQKDELLGMHDEPVKVEEKDVYL